jgi:hypothetical protein
MENERPFHSVQHPVTRRWAVLEDNGTAAWLYVTEPDVPKPVADCFVYNCQPPADELPKSWDRAGPPPITTRYASDSAYRPGVSADRVRVGWTERGDAVTALVDDEPVAFLVVGEPRGYSRAIAVDGPYGHPWDEARFAACFREHLNG